MTRLTEGLSLFTRSTTAHFIFFSHKNITGARNIMKQKEGETKLTSLLGLSRKVLKHGSIDILANFHNEKKKL